MMTNTIIMSAIMEHDLALDLSFGLDFRLLMSFTPSQVDNFDLHSKSKLSFMLPLCCINRFCRAYRCAFIILITHNYKEISSDKPQSACHVHLPRF
jgi:hypothetical protein